MYLKHAKQYKLTFAIYHVVQEIYHYNLPMEKRLIESALAA